MGTLNMDNTVVISYDEEALTKVVEGLKLKDRLKNMHSVLIKPNLRAAAIKNYKRCSITNPLLIRELAFKLKDIGLEVSVGECSPSKFITDKALKNSGIDVLACNGIDILNFNSCKLQKIKISGRLGHVYIPDPVLDKDFLISFPVMKTHSMTLVSLSLKNMIGALGPNEPPRIHYAGLSESIVEINTVVKPDLSLIDGTFAMEGSGPVRGGEIELGVTIGGYDPVSVDSVGARVMGFNPYEIDHISMAEKRGLGSINPDMIDGELKVHRFLRPGEDKVGFINLYSWRWFNLIMCNRIVHSIAYDYFYYLFKSIRKKLSI